MHARRFAARVVIVGVVVSIAAAVTLAPVLTVGWCADASVPELSRCGTEHRSLLGATVPWWLWLGVQVTIIAATLSAARRAVRNPPRRVEWRGGDGTL